MLSARGQRYGGVRSAAVAGGLVLAAGTLTAGVAVAAHASGTDAPRNVRLSLGYACSFPAATASVQTKVSVTIAATFPAAATAGRRIQPTGVRITVGLPPAAVTALRNVGAAAVSSTAILSVNASQRATTTTSWQGAALTAQPLPATGSLTIAAPGRAAPVTVASGRAVTFVAAGLTLALQLADATGDSPSPSASTVSPSPSASTVSPSPGSGDSASSGSASPGAAELHVGCSPTSHAGTTLDAVPVVAASTSRNSPAHRGKPKLPKGCGHIKVVGNSVALCGYVTGYSDVAKLYGAVPLQPRRPALPAFVNLDFAAHHAFKHGKLVEYTTGELDYHGRPELPPVRATFLAFRFVPVTATVSVTELTPIRIVSVSGITAPPYPLLVRATTTVAIRISDVDVNGVPLAIGPHCRPVSSTKLTLIGHGDNTIPPTGYTIPTGGPLSGNLTIPAFTGCGVTENLDPLLTGSISGSGNYVLLTQGKLCGPSQPQSWTCPPPVPKPIR